MRLAGQHFAAATLYLLAGSLGLCWIAPDLAAGAWLSPRVAGVTHLFTLGWLTTTIWEIDDRTPDRVLVRIRRATPESHERNATMPTSPPLELDVRPISPREKHPTIFRTFDDLAAGEAMVIINDHDPRPLRYQFQAERPERFDWEYEEEGPEVWRVRISRR